MLTHDPGPITIAYKPSDRNVMDQLQELFELPGVQLLPLTNTAEEKSYPLIRFVQNKLYLEDAGEKLFFHPSMALLRMINISRGTADRFLEAINLEAGDIFFDATMGLASDSLIAAYAVGMQGKVIAVESSSVIYFLVKDGLTRLKRHHPEKSANQEKMQAWAELVKAALRVETVYGPYEEILTGFADKSVDVIYFDPMFRHTVKDSSSMRPIKKWSNQDPLNLTAIKEACRVAKKRVVLKERKGSFEFNRLGFIVIEGNRYSPVSYGVIDLTKEGEVLPCSP